MKIGSFHRDFSEIPPFQKKYSLIYEAERDEPDSGVCFRVSRRGERPLEEELWVTGISEMYALDMIRYLWENAVPAETWKEILMDILAQITNMESI